ncbi:MAG: amidohydrolase family protein [Cyclobacteriaceae bacterium]
MLMGALLPGFSQKYFPVNGVADVRPSKYALTNATIFVDYQTKIENATIIVNDGRVVQVGQNISPAKDVQVIDLAGKFIYPAFVDPYTSYGLSEVERSGGRGPNYDADREGAYAWNDAIKSDFKSIDDFDIDSKAAAELRKNGFGAVLSFRADGIFRGTSLMVSTGTDAVHEMVLKEEASAHLSFNKGSSSQLYPTSIMGAVALIRQSYLDAKWYRDGGSKLQVNRSLSAINGTKALPQIFEANSNKLRSLLVDKVGDEFGIQYIIKGNGDEYQRLEAIKATGASFILPVKFPDAYDVDDPYEALDISLADLKHWELAPANAFMLDQQGVEIAFTANGLEKKKEYLPSIQKAVDAGLSRTSALKAMTYTPAKLVGLQNEIGTLKSGSRANFIISEGELFTKDFDIYETWIHGKKYVVKDINELDLAGSYNLMVGQDAYELKISGESGAHKAKLMINDTIKIDTKLTIDDFAVSLSFEHEGALVRLSGWVENKSLSGSARLSDGSWKEWSASPIDEQEEESEDEKDEKDNAVDLGGVIYPFVAYGSSETPKQETILIKNATVWTLERDGKLENTDVLVQNGKIVGIGQDLVATGAREIDATGKHLTPGIIDEHTHAALSGVNESSHAITSEVRMQDAIDSEDIDIYRQLAGGVTAAQQLHGSANPVGGQSSIIKFKWGSLPSEMSLEGADPFIKFALGENVKQSNRSREWNTRFPQTRMGVEQVYVDGFSRAQQYQAEWDKYNSLSKKAKSNTTAPRRDLQLEALSEIVNKQRFITCHSYVQSEINMLMKVAESFDFNVNTFTHILEGYKVADKMAVHGVGGSTFSDWWAYKYEVKDAIPYNAALMTQAGVTVAINSDDGEMARRLNQEAGKSLKYGDMDELEALKMVTLNPAKLLHLDDRMGSIKAGKDADLVLWSDHPLSIYAKSEMTMVDGIVYFDLETDKELRQYIKEERARLILKMKEVKENGGKTQSYRPKEKHRWHCDEFADEFQTLND